MFPYHDNPLQLENISLILDGTCVLHLELCIVHGVFLLPMYIKGSISARGVFSHTIGIVSLPL